MPSIETSPYGIRRVAKVSVPLDDARAEAMTLVGEREYERGYLGVTVCQGGLWQSQELQALVESFGWGFQVQTAFLLGQEAEAGEFRPHTDEDFGLLDGDKARLHFPLVSHPKAHMSLWERDGEIDQHLEPGWVYYFDPRKPHSIANPSPVDRIHLVVDVTVTDQVRDLVFGACRRFTRDDWIMAGMGALNIPLLCWLAQLPSI